MPNTRVHIPHMSTGYKKRKHFWQCKSSATKMAIKKTLLSIGTGKQQEKQENPERCKQLNLKIQYKMNRSGNNIFQGALRIVEILIQMSMVYETIKKEIR